MEELEVWINTETLQKTIPLIMSEDFELEYWKKIVITWFPVEVINYCLCEELDDNKKRNNIMLNKSNNLERDKFQSFDNSFLKRRIPNLWKPEAHGNDIRDNKLNRDLGHYTFIVTRFV